MEWILLLLWAAPVGWAVTTLLLQRREPSSTIFWLCLVFFFPGLGVFLFFLFGPQRLERAAIKRKENIKKQVIRDYYFENADDSISTEANNILTLAGKISEYGATSGNKIQILSDPEEALQAMVTSIQAATSFIHVEYYIIEYDEVTQELFVALEEACQRGVEVRILYDSLGSLFLNRRYFSKLLASGAKVAGFLPITAFLQRININFRNHRKILVVDGKIGFTGSANIGKNYLGKARKNQWRDYVVQVEGPAVLQLQDVFAKDWHFTTKEDLFSKQYYPPPKTSGNALIQVLESGPDTPFHNLHQALFMAINQARKQALITTPYFIPDSAMLTALTVSALKGVNIDLVVPKKSDSRVVQAAGRSFYGVMLRAGARIFEYRPRVMHSKLMVIDDIWTVLGSFNMDIRSFKLNFELNLFIHSREVADQCRQIFDSDIEDSTELSLREHQQRSYSSKLIENACRLLSPLL